MRIERINENKIRIFISFEDLEARDIDLGSFSYNSPETQELFWDLMEQAELEFGFDTNESQLCIEAVSDMEQGFIITITKLDDDGEFESIQKFVKNRYKRRDLKIKQKTSHICSSILIYNIHLFDDLCTLCKRIESIFTGESCVYTAEGEYYLVLSRVDGNVLNTHLFDCILSEYADKVDNPSFFESYLNEHARLLIPEKAVQILSQHFSK